MVENSIMSDILRELKKIKKENRFPDHIVAQAAVVNVGAGSLLKKSVEYKYDSLKQSEDIKLMYDMAINTAACAIRFIEEVECKTIIEKT